MKVIFWRNLPNDPTGAEAVHEVECDEIEEKGPFVRILRRSVNDPAYPEVTGEMLHVMSISAKSFDYYEVER